MKITANKFVTLQYELYVDAAEENGEMELMEQTTPEQPLEFIFGVGMMLPKFEGNIFGLQNDETFDFTILAEEAYGEYKDEHLLDLDRAIFEQDGAIDEAVIFEGNQVPLMDAEGNRLNAQIVSVGAEKIKVDLNHPLAGENLHFKGKIIEVRDATDQEMAALMGGGCGSGCGCGDSSHEEADQESDCGSCGCGCG